MSSIAHPDEVSAAMRAGIALGYGGLIAVNGIFGTGAFGVPTNQVLSAAYPSVVTPAGFTFAIWGPIFLLQMGGTVYIASGLGSAASIAIAPMWLSTWAAEVAWQLVFANVPIPPKQASESQRLLVLAPASVLLLTAYGSMLTAAFRLRQALTAHPAANSLAVSVLLAFPSGLNAGWLAAASGIGLTLVAQLTPLQALAKPVGGATLLGFLVAAGAALAPTLGHTPSTLALGLGYATATAWACYGMTKGDSPDVVKSVAGIGVMVAIVSGGAALSVAFASYFTRASASEGKR
mmetsp:Transcript_27642/g.76491  ORF Transcript_27642/g.76491 Transcript_27642/m.76491 type:complete len:292 (+) Transcript_27642:85-960(+)|eukprot:CAMPEP_0117464048 /NCGR_PEP_ID=MMETSP0784-20121206/3899_1 /TAXON_ID=39447 /ORGANISM="" /LENGTH=291 /DNA_ID=CAMNT_0005257893 /DNA_START=43 /DNA_END=918 /DNA_ORIENTATION=-